jgi:hypothetical protein
MFKLINNSLIFYPTITIDHFTRDFEKKKIINPVNYHAIHHEFRK